MVHAQSFDSRLASCNMTKPMRKDYHYDNELPAVERFMVVSDEKVLNSFRLFVKGDLFSKDVK